MKIISTILFLVIAIASHATSSTSVKIGYQELPLFLDFVYTTSRSTGEVLNRLPIPRRDKMQAARWMSDHKVNQFVLSSATIAIKGNGLSVSFDSSDAKLLFNTEKKEFYLNSKKLVIPAQADFDSIVSIMENRLSAETSSLFQMFVIEKAHANFATIGMLAAFVVTIHHTTFCKPGDILCFKEDTLAKLAADEKRIADSGAGDAAVFFALLAPRDFECDGKKVKRIQGGLSYGERVFKLQEQLAKKLANAKIPESKDSIKRSFISDRASIPSREVNFQYENESLVGFNLDNPVCKFSIDAKGIVSSPDTSSECNALRVNANRYKDGKHPDYETFLFSLGFPLKQSEDCCRSKCQGLVKKMIEQHKSLAMPGAGSTQKDSVKQNHQ